MFVYERNKKLYGTNTVPHDNDAEVTYEDNEGNVITLTEGDSYTDDGHGGMVRKSDNKNVNMLFDGKFVIPRGKGEDTSYTISFDKNGGSGTMANKVAYKNIPFTLPSNEFTAPASHRFKNWEVNGTAYNAGDTVMFTEDTTVKAIWQLQYVVSFNANGGTGSMDNIIADAGSTITLPESTFTAPEEKEFTYWTINDVQYPAGSQYTVTSNVTFKANWRYTWDTNPMTSAEATAIGYTWETV